MKCKQFVDQSQDIHSRDTWKDAESWLEKCLGGDDTEVAWKLKLQDKIVNADFLGEMLVGFANFHADHQVQVRKTPRAWQVKAIVMEVLQILRKKRLISHLGKHCFATPLTTFSCIRTISANFGTNGTNKRSQSIQQLVQTRPVLATKQNWEKHALLFHLVLHCGASLARIND
jgi:hypothetical protein